MKNKELDQLFQAHLQQREITPSAQVWQRVAQQLPRPRRGYAISAAAVLLVAVAITWYAQQQQEELQLPIRSYTIETPASALPLQPVGYTMAAAPVLPTRPVALAANEPAGTQVALPVKVRPKSVAQAALPVNERAIRALTDGGQLPVTEQQKRTLALLPLAQTQDWEPQSRSENPFKEKALAYAGEQFNNLLTGQKPRLPRLSREPVVEIHLQPLFKNP